MWKEGQNVWVFDILSFMLFKLNIFLCMGLPCSSDGKESACNAGEFHPIPGSGRSPGEGNGNPLQYSCLENPMDIAAWHATVQFWNLQNVSKFEWALSQGCKDSSIFANQTMWYTTWTNWKIKTPWLSQ